MRAARAAFPILAALAVILTGPGPACAQAPGPAPFSRLDVALRGVADFGESDLHDDWTPGRGVELATATPFYAGDLDLVARFIANTARDGADVPDMPAFSLFGGWSFDRTVGGGLRAGLGGAIGITDWIASYADNEGASSELEIGTEVSARLGFVFAGTWRADAICAWQATFTRERIDLVLVSAGLTKSFDAPGWIRSVLE